MTYLFPKTALTPGTYTYPEVTTLVSDDLRSPHDLPCARRLLLRPSTYIYLIGTFSPPAAFLLPGNILLLPRQQIPLSQAVSLILHRQPFLLTQTVFLTAICSTVNGTLLLHSSRRPLLPTDYFGLLFSQQPSLASADRPCSPINTFV